MTWVQPKYKEQQKISNMLIDYADAFQLAFNVKTVDGKRILKITGFDKYVIFNIGEETVDFIADYNDIWVETKGFSGNHIDQYIARDVIKWVWKQ